MVSRMQPRVTALNAATTVQGHLYASRVRPRRGSCTPSNRKSVHPQKLTAEGQLLPSAWRPRYWPGLEEQPEHKAVCDEEQRHEDRDNEVCSTQLTRFEANLIALIEGEEEIGGAPDVECPCERDP